jgi:hypothetical protein
MTIAVDVEVVVDISDGEDVATVHAVLYHYLPLGTPEPEDGLYFVRGKIGCMTSNINVGDGSSADAYQLLIEADFVCLLFTSYVVLVDDVILHVRFLRCCKRPTSLRSCPSSLTLLLCALFFILFMHPHHETTKIGTKYIDERTFRCDVSQFMLGDTRLCATRCTFPTSVARFVDKPPMRREPTGMLPLQVSSQTFAMGLLLETLLSKSIMFDIHEITYISREASDSPGGSPKKSASVTRLGWFSLSRM